MLSCLIDRLSGRKIYAETKEELLDKLRKEMSRCATRTPARPAATADDDEVLATNPPSWTPASLLRQLDVAMTRLGYSELPVRTTPPPHRKNGSSAPISHYLESSGFVWDCGNLRKRLPWD